MQKAHLRTSQIIQVSTFNQNSSFIAERNKNTQIHNAEKRGREEGVKEGAQQKAVETAHKLLADGKYTADEISSLLNIPVESFTETERT